MSTSKPIKVTLIDNYRISTVELPGDLWFETMVFQIDALDRWNERDVARYDTRDEAIVGHEVMVGRWKELLHPTDNCYQCGEPTDGDTIKDEDIHGNIGDRPICRPCRYDMFGKDTGE